MMKTKILSAILLIFVLFMVGCSTTKNTESINSVPTNVDKQTINTDSNNNIVIISIKNFQFNPTSITIKSGTTIRWINEDSASHTIKSNDFNSEKLVTGKEFEFVFSKPGTYDYICGLHPSMKGRIIVE